MWAPLHGTVHCTPQPEGLWVHPGQCQQGVPVDRSGPSSLCSSSLAALSQPWAWHQALSVSSRSPQAL